MPGEAEVYRQHSDLYERLIAREDYRQNIPNTLNSMIPSGILDIVDLGAGTGRLGSMFAAKAGRLIALDASHHMLKVCQTNLQRLAPQRSWALVADHRFVPLAASSADVILSGWSVSYLATWDPSNSEKNLEAWLREARRVLRENGRIILLESLGTGKTTPQRLRHLESAYRWLDGQRFKHMWIRTDYRFESLAEALELAGFFFGPEMAQRIKKENLVILPECTGIWWKEKISADDSINQL